MAKATRDIAASFPWTAYELHTVYSNAVLFSIQHARVNNGTEKRSSHKLQHASHGRHNSRNGCNRLVGNMRMLADRFQQRLHFRRHLLPLLEHRLHLTGQVGMVDE